MDAPKRPLKAPTEPITDEQLATLKYPLYGSPKVDGFRATIQGGKVLSASLKPIPNEYVQQILGKPELEGLDGELVVGRPYPEFEGDDVFNRTSGPLRRKGGEPDFTFLIFDSFLRPEREYWDRLMEVCCIEYFCVEVIPQIVLHTSEEVFEYEAEMLRRGFEGIMLRDPYAPYKFGRCTHKEGYVFKRKPFTDCEAVIIGFEEQEENLNKATVSEMGLTKRSSHKENKRPKGTLGKFILKSDKWEKPFACGTGVGLTEALRKDIWDNKEKYLNQIVTIKYQAYGSLEKPRLPIFKGFRPEWDITKEVA